MSNPIETIMENINTRIERSEDRHEKAKDRRDNDECIRQVAIMNELEELYDDIESQL